MSLLDYEITTMDPSERNMVMRDWMLNTRHHRSRIEKSIRDGVVLVARSRTGIALGWLAYKGDVVGCAYVKSRYRELGVLRSLWERAGCPHELMDPAPHRARSVLKRLWERRGEIA